MLKGEKMVFAQTPCLLLRKVTAEDYPYFRNYLMDKEMDRMMLRTPCKTTEDVPIGTLKSIKRAAGIL